VNLNSNRATKDFVLIGSYCLVNSEFRALNWTVIIVIRRALETEVEIGVSGVHFRSFSSSFQAESENHSLPFVWVSAAT
jgi:hypothetical protein